MKRIDGLKDAYEKERARQEAHKKNPNTPEAKKTVRIGGLFMFVLGCVGAGVVYYLYAYEALISGWASAFTVTFLGLGLYAIAFGKMPKSK